MFGLLEEEELGLVLSREGCNTDGGCDGDEHAGKLEKGGVIDWLLVEDNGCGTAVLPLLTIVASATLWSLPLTLLLLLLLFPWQMSYLIIFIPFAT